MRSSNHSGAKVSSSRHGPIAAIGQHDLHRLAEGLGHGVADLRFHRPSTEARTSISRPPHRCGPRGYKMKRPPKVCHTLFLGLGEQPESTGRPKSKGVVVQSPQDDMTVVPLG